MIAAGTPAMARNQLSRVATASLNACVVVPGIFAATLPVQPMGTKTVGRMIRCQLSRAVVRLEMSYQLETVAGPAENP